MPERARMTSTAAEAVRLAKKPYLERVAALHKELSIPADYAKRGLAYHNEAGELVVGELDPNGKEMRTEPKTAEGWRRMKTPHSPIAPGSHRDAVGRQVGSCPECTDRSCRRIQGGAVIRRCTPADFDTIFEIVNDAAMAYKGVIPADRWHDPYMSKAELRAAIDGGVEFRGFELDGMLAGVMGVQPVQDVTLIRHAYVRTSHRRHGIGGQLLEFCLARIRTPTLIGTWAAADWAIRFYQKHGFRLVTPEEKDQLLPKYWGVPKRQIETSVVLGDQRWFQDE